MLGYNIVSASSFGATDWSGTAASASAFTYSCFIGARYYLNDKIAAFAELGYGIAAFELGVAIKF